MKAYVCRNMTGADRVAMETLCMSGQNKYVHKRAVAWNPATLNAVEHRLRSGVAETRDGKDLAGVLIMDLQATATPPMVEIVGMAPLYEKLPRKEQLGICYSLLLWGYPYCVEAKIELGYGRLEPSEDLLMEVFARVSNFQREVEGTVPELLTAASKPGIYRVTVRIDESYRLALEKALEAL